MGVLFVGLRPHPFMPADVMTEDDLAKSNAAHFLLLRARVLRVRSENTALQDRRKHPATKGVSHASFVRQLAFQSPPQVHVHCGLFFPAWGCCSIVAPRYALQVASTC